MTSQDARYEAAVSEFGPALARLARFYEANQADRHDLLQEIHLALWRSFALFDGRCSVRSWVYRVAHNVAASHVLSRRRQARVGGETLDALDDMQAPGDPEAHAAGRDTLLRLLLLIRALKPPDAQVMLLYLEDVPAAEIGDITGLSAGAVATRIHRVKNLLSRNLRGGVHDHE